MTTITQLVIVAELALFVVAVEIEKVVSMARIEGPYIDGSKCVAGQLGGGIAIEVALPALKVTFQRCVKDVVGMYTIDGIAVLRRHFVTDFTPFFNRLRVFFVDFAATGVKKEQPAGTEKKMFVSQSHYRVLM